MSQKYGGGWDVRVAAFLRRFPEYLSSSSESAEEEENVAFPTPRIWEWVAVQLHRYPEMPLYMLAGLLGEETAAKLAAFLASEFDIEVLLKTPQAWWQLNLDQKILAATQLPRVVRLVDEFNKVEPLLKVIAEDSIEYLALIITSLERSERKKFIELLRVSLPEAATKLIALGVHIASFRI